MPERYGRAFCTTELRMRNAIFEKIHSGWSPTVAFDGPNEDLTGNWMSANTQPLAESATPGAESELNDT